MCTRTILKFEGQIALLLKLIIEPIQEQNIFGCHDLLPGPLLALRTYEGSPWTCDLLHTPADACLKSSSVTKEAWGQSRLLEVRQELFLHCWLSDIFIVYIIKIFRYTIIFEIGTSWFFSVFTCVRLRERLLKSDHQKWPGVAAKFLQLQLCLSEVTVYL